MANTPTAHREAVAAEVRAWMGRRRATQAHLATALGKSQPYVSRRLSGEVPFDVDDLSRLAEFFDVSLGDLLDPAARRLLLELAGRSDGPEAVAPTDELAVAAA